MRIRYFNVNTFIIISVFLLSTLFSCKSIDTFSGFRKGENKNSLPLLEKNLLEEVHSIVIPPFYADYHSWTEITHNIFTSESRITVIGDKNSLSLPKNTIKVLSSLNPENRSEYLSSIGKSVKADAVLNGIILGNVNKHEIILQLISSKDSRILWWQAVDFSFKKNALSPSDQQILMFNLLESLLEHIGKREKPVVIPTKKIQPKIKQKPKPDKKPKTVIKPKKPKKSEKVIEPLPADISPM